MNNKERFNKFNGSNNWKNHFVWHGIYGESLFTKISIDKFSKSTGKLNVITFKNTLDFYKQMKNMACEYSDWCGSVMPKLTNEELNNLKLFFIGTIGEYFFVNLFNHKNSLVVGEKNKIYTFYNICPRLMEDTDFGVDLTGTVSPSTGGSYDCAIQVKFWSPFANESIISNKIAQSVHSDAIENNMIDNKDDDNIFICWLGDMEHVSKWLSKNKLSRHIVFINRKVLKQNIDGDVEFWNKISEEISKI